MKQKLLIWVILGLFPLISCEQSTIYSETYTLREKKWWVKDIPKFTFEISDSSKKYTIYYLIRNSSAYEYNNFYVQRKFISSQKDTTVVLDQLFLFDPKTGKPSGSGLGDTFDHKIVMMENQKLTKGTHTIEFIQYMRQEPLSEIVSVGLQVEKVK